MKDDTLVVPEKTDLDRSTLSRTSNAEEDFCDVVIRSEDNRKFPAHRAILTARLDYFRSMFSYGWVEVRSLLLFLLLLF